MRNARPAGPRTDVATGCCAYDGPVSALMWWLIPIGATVLAVAWAMFRARPEKPTEAIEGMEHLRRMQAAIERPLPQTDPIRQGRRKVSESEHPVQEPPSQPPLSQPAPVQPAPVQPATVRPVDAPSVTDDASGSTVESNPDDTDLSEAGGR